MNKEKISKLLNGVLFDLLYGGATDPGEEALQGAAAIWFVLSELEIEVDKDYAEDMLESITRENVYDHNFLAELLEEDDDGFNLG